MSTMTAPSQHGRPDQTLAHNMKLIAHHEMEGFGGVGEGISMQLTNDGRRVLWLAHESAPKNFTAIDVTDPTNPKQIIQTELPHMKVRSNSLELSGNTLVVAYQTKEKGDKPAGIDIFDITIPEKPVLMSHFDCSGPHSRGVHAVWFVDGKTVHMASGAGDFEPNDPVDDQFYMIVDVSDLKAPKEIGRWWMPGTRKGDAEPVPERKRFNAGHRAHNTNVYPDRPDRAYVGYIDGGAYELDISNPADIKVVSQWNHSPPFNGFTHTMLPLPARHLWICSDECVKDDGVDYPKLVWVVDSRNPKNPVPISTFPMPDPAVFTKRGGRYGAHNLHENHPSPVAFRSDTLIFGTFFNGGVRVFDTTDPFHVQEVAYFVPGKPRLSPSGAVQINDVYVDDRKLVYAVDRFGGGLYILEMTI